jgi:hypothetical protein
LVAKEVSIRLHGELEQAQDWRVTAEKLNKELKKQLDDLKDFIDNEVFTFAFFLIKINDIIIDNYRFALTKKKMVL